MMINRPSQVSIRLYDVNVVPPNTSSRHCDCVYDCACYCQQLVYYWNALSVAAMRSIYPGVDVDVDVDVDADGLYCWVRMAVETDLASSHLSTCQEK